MINNQGIKAPPHNLEAEFAVLSAMLLDQKGLSLGLESLDRGDFYNPAHQISFVAMEELFIENTPVDLVTLNDKLVEKGVFEKIGGLAYLTKLSTSMSTSANISHHIRIVYEKSTLRKLIKASSEISHKSYEAQEDLDNIVDFAEKSIFNILENKKSSEFTHIRDVLVDSFDNIEKAAQSGSNITGVETGFADLDYQTAGLQPSDLILIAARPSMGKSALALNIAHHAAKKNNVKTAIFSLEMSQEQMVNRMLCTEALVDAQKLRTGNLANDDWLSIVKAMGPLSKAPIYFDDTPGISVAELRAKCRRLKLEKGLDLIIIDYLQLMGGSNRPESRQQEISEISRSLKGIAREMNAPVVALSQLSRACEQRNDHRPILSDLRDSGAIEQDADIVAFIYRDEYYNPDSEKKNIAEIIIAKQRNGPTGTIELAWLSKFAKFSDLQKTY